jgi:uncharacterized protein YabE (DUF348 family)
MKSLTQGSSISFGAIIGLALFFVVVAITVLSGVTYADNADAAKGGRLITIHDRGNSMVILSHAMTVGDALKEANIDVDVKDAVEPAVDQQLVASDYQVNIYRARPVIIVDGSIKTKVITPYQTTKQIAESADIKLYDEDITLLERTEDIVSDGAGLQMIIDRAVPINLTLYGKTSVVRTQANTVSEMLVEKGIILGDSDRLSLDVSTAITEGMNLRVWREGKQTITLEEPVKFDIEKIENADLAVDYREVKTAGKDGLRSVSYEITIQDGVEVKRTEIASITLKKPETQIEVIGVKGQYTTPSENENITWDFLIANGFSRIQTAGIMGNLMQEHRFNTTDATGGLGIVQWIGGRRANLIAQYHTSYTNIYSQLNFLMYELNGSYSYVRDMIKGSGSLTESVQIFQNQFERCGICREELRIEYAQTILGSH